MPHRGCLDPRVKAPRHDGFNEHRPLSATQRLKLRPFSGRHPLQLWRIEQPDDDPGFGVLALLQLRPRAQTFRVTPAMEAGIADNVWGIDEIDNLLAE